jgi:hypothetical protein
MLLQTLTPVVEKATELQADADLQLTDVTDKSELPSLTNASAVQVAQTTCSSQIQQSNQLTSGATMANTQAFAGVEAAQNARQRARQLLTSVQNLAILDAEMIQQLKQDVIALRTDFESRHLATMITAVQGAVTEQQDWLASMKSKKNKMEQDGARLNALQQQLIP